MEQIKLVGIWIRVSTEEQVKGESPEHHEKRARYYAESKSWIVKEVYHLEAVSGKSVMEHAETKRMLADIQSGKISGIIFSKLARLARNTKELLDFAEIFRSCNADLISLQESIDTSSPSGRLFYTMIAAMAQWEREEIAERVAASVPIRAKLGKPLGGAAPFGYQWVDKKLIVNRKEAPVRKLMCELFVEHKRKKRVARILNESGYRTRQGTKWSDTTIDRQLRDPVAKGLRRANYTKSLGKDKKWELKPEKDWVFSEVEAIVSEELWNTCNHILDEQRKNHKQPSRKAVHLFGGIAVCSCGRKMYVPSNSPKYTCAKCKNKIPTTDLESVYQEQLKSFFFSHEEINSQLSNANQLIREKEELLQTLSNEEKKIRQELDHIIRLYLDNELPKESVGKHYRPLEERLKEIQNQLPELQGELDFLKINYLSNDHLLHEAEDLYSRWSNLEYPEKRQIIETITQKVIVGTNDITIDFLYQPSSSKLMTTGQHNFMDSSHTQA